MLKYERIFMTRRELRTYTFKLLYRTFFYSEEEMNEQQELFFDDSELEIDVFDTEYVRNRVNAVMEKIEEIDKAIDDKATSWKVNRMNYVDLTIIRLAYYEINYDDDIPMAVAINEAVELAKSIGIKMNFKSQGLDQENYLANVEKLAYLAYEDQCSPANPKLPLVDDMMKILQDSYEATKFEEEYGDIEGLSENDFERRAGLPQARSGI